MLTVIITLTSVKVRHQTSECVSKMPKKHSKSPEKRAGKSQDDPTTIILDDDYEAADAGASLTYPLQCSALRKNGHVLLKGFPCKIVSMHTSSPGKHGHAKVQLVGLDIFTGKKYEEITPASHNMEVPIVVKKDYILITMSRDGYVSILDDKGNTRQDLVVGDDTMRKSLQGHLDKDEDVLVTVMTAMDQEAVIGIKMSRI